MPIPAFADMGERRWLRDRAPYTYLEAVTENSGLPDGLDKSLLVIFLAEASSPHVLVKC